MKICWQHGCNVICAGKVFKDGFGAIVMLSKMQNPWVWKVSNIKGD